MVLGFQFASPASASTTCFAVACFSFQTTFMTSHSASEIRGGPFRSRLFFLVKLIIVFPTSVGNFYPTAVGLQALNTRNVNKGLAPPFMTQLVIGFDRHVWEGVLGKKAKGT